MPRYPALGSIGRASARYLAVLAALAICSAVLFASACTPTRTSDTVPSAVVPSAWDLSTPTSAVDSYLGWVTYSYRMMNSEVCSATMTPEEWVRVDAYIQLNAQKKRGLDQQLVRADLRSASEDGTGAVVALAEEWRYRYFTPDTLQYDGPEHSASYETTYTLVNADGVWRVDAVEALSLSEIQ